MSAVQLRAHLEFFGELGVDGFRRESEWRTRETVERELIEPEPTEPELADPEPLEPKELQPSEPVEPSEPPEPMRVFASQAEALQAIKIDVGPDCSRCKLHTLGRRQVVFGVGNPNADLMFVGEGDEQVVPLQSKACVAAVILDRVEHLLRSRTGKLASR